MRRNVTPLADQASNKFISQEIEGLRSFGVVMPGIFLAVAALVLNVLLSRLVDQQRVVIGTLKALGYADWQVMVHFVKFALWVGLIGGLFGCVGGYAMAGLLTRIYRQFFEFPDLTNRIYPTVYLIGLAISILCALLGCLRGARATLRLRPAEAMRAKPPARGGAVWLQRVGWVWRRLSFAPRPCNV